MDRVETESTTPVTQERTIASLIVKAAISENRKSKSRVAFCRPGSITLANDDAQRPAFTRDVSDNGLGLLHQMPISPQVVETEIQLSNGSKLKFHVDLKWTSDCGQGYFISGGLFTIVAEPKRFVSRMMSKSKRETVEVDLPNNVSQLLADAKQWGVERRACGRMPFFQPATVRPINGTTSQPAFTREISEAGISLVHWTPIRLGDATIAMDVGGSVLETPLTIEWSHRVGKGLFVSGGHA